MGHSGVRSSIGIGIAVLACFGPGANSTAAQQLRVENFYPHQAPPGQTTLFTLAVTSRDAVQGAEITPAGGVAVVGRIDERGRPVRYQTMYVNMPDVPKPAPR